MALPQTVDTRGVSDPLERLGLEGERLEAARTVDHDALVLAGPGAGKTYLLVAHAAHLAEHYTGRVVMLTYTRNAARDLERRVAGLVSPHAARRVVAGTIHAHALGLLRVHGHRLGLGRPLEILLDSRDVQAFASEVAGETGEAAPAGFSRHLERLLRRRALSAEDRQGETLVGRVMKRMREQGKLSWESSVDLAIELLAGDQEVVASVRHHDRSLLLDEAQDCDPAQLELVNHLVGNSGGSGGPHLFVAMDPDQSLYAFRDADPELVRRWAESHDPEIFELTENYRCAPRIVALARHVLERPGKLDMIADCGIARFFSGPTRDAEAEFVAQAVKRRVAEGVSPARIAVLARRNALLDGVRDALIARQVKVRKATRSGFSAQEERLLAVLELLHEREEGEPPGPRTGSILYRIFDIDQERIRDLEIRALHGEISHPTEAIDDQRWSALLKLRESPVHPADLIVRSAEIFDWHLDSDEVLKGLAAQTRTLAQLLRRARQGDLPGGRPRQGVLVSSFHGSKGLEFDTVFLVGCEDGVIPDFRARTPKALREERRALYVAMTRAAKEVVVTCSGSGPSRFLPASTDPLWSQA